MAAEPSDSGHVRIVGAFAGLGSGEAVAIFDVVSVTDLQPVLFAGHFRIDEGTHVRLSA